MMHINNPAPLVVVEDNDEDFETFQTAFQAAGGGNQLKRCCDGREALDYLYHRANFSNEEESPKPALLILDLNLPGIDGRQVLTTIKQDPELKKIPVMVLTTSSNPKDINYCYSQGANCYTIKPVDLEKFEKLISLIKEFWLDNTILPDNPNALVPV